MTNARIAVCLLACLVLNAPDAVGQGAASSPPAGESDNSVLSWFGRSLQVRKAFDGGKAETEAAAVGLVAPGRNSDTYWLVDVGLRTVPLNHQLNSAGTLEVFYYPSVEWHHLNAEPLVKQEGTHKAGGALNAELWFPPVTPMKLRAAVIGKAGRQRNLIKDATEDSVSLAVETCAEGAETHSDGGWEGGLRPCAELTYNGARRMHYYPYVGYERYSKLPISAQNTTVAPAFTGSLLFVRVQADAYPFNTEAAAGDMKGLVLNLDYTYRRVLDGDDGGLVPSNANSLKAGATYFFVKGQVVGLGMTVELGRSPAVNFISQRRAVLALRVKTRS
ncbi:MAG: hypothetical protein ABL982_02040 [Vicinamibacterales bacterium]